MVAVELGVRPRFMGNLRRPTSARRLNNSDIVVHRALVMASVRKDVARNRAELLAAAERVLAEHGPHVHLNVIAATAGVGQGTLYRHFPNRQALMLALVERCLERLEEFARNQGSVNALFLFLQFYASNAREFVAVAEYGRIIDPMHPQVVVARERFITLMDTMLQKAIEARLCRPDLSVDDIRSVFSMLNAISHASSAASSSSFVQRALELIVGGLERR